MGVLAGGAMGGIGAYKNGTNIAAGIFGGAINGGAVGLASGLGIVAAAVGFGIAWGITALTVSVGANFLAGVASYKVEYRLNGNEINERDALQNGGMQALSGIFAFITGALIGSTGLFNIPGNNTGLLPQIGTGLLSDEWILNVVVAQIVKLVGYYPFNWVFQKYKK